MARKGSHFSSMSNHFLLRAFDLADSGKYSTVSEIRAVMAREGFSLAELSQLSGRQLTRQLRARMAAARPKAQAGYPGNGN